MLGLYLIDRSNKLHIHELNIIMTNNFIEKINDDFKIQFEKELDSSSFELMSLTTNKVAKNNNLKTSSDVYFVFEKSIN